MKYLLLSDWNFDAANPCNFIEITYRQNRVTRLALENVNLNGSNPTPSPKLPSQFNLSQASICPTTVSPAKSLSISPISATTTVNDFPHLLIIYVGNDGENLFVVYQSHSLISMFPVTASPIWVVVPHNCRIRRRWIYFISGGGGGFIPKFAANNGERRRRWGR